MIRWQVALHAFVGKPDNPGHGSTDSARYTIDAETDFEAVVLATARFCECLEPPETILSASPWVWLD